MYLLPIRLFLVTICNCNAAFNIRIWKDFFTVFFIVQNLQVLIIEHLFIPLLWCSTCIE